MPKLDDDDPMAWVDSHWVTVVLVALVLLIVWFAQAPASPSCMTKSEARHRWPTTHIWWHGRGHCWDNRRGGSIRYRYRDPVFSKVQAAAAVPVVPAVPSVPPPMYFVLSLDRYMRFLPWEQRIAGSF